MKRSTRYLVGGKQDILQDAEMCVLILLLSKHQWEIRKYFLICIKHPWKKV